MSNFVSTATWPAPPHAGLARLGQRLRDCRRVYLHSCAASPNCTLPSDILSFLREDDLIVQPIEIKESYAIVSDRPDSEWTWTKTRVGALPHEG